MESDIFSSILALILGWLLGMLSPVIVDAIKSQRDARLGRAAIENELLEFASVLLAASFRIHGSSGQINRSFLEWLESKCEADSGNGRNAKRLAFARQILLLPDDQIVNASQRLAAADGKSPRLQKYPLPLLDHRISALHALDADTQVRILQIKRNVTLLDAIVDQSHEFFRMTFSQISDQNHDLVRDNLWQTHNEYAYRAKLIVDQIHELRTVT